MTLTTADEFTKHLQEVEQVQKMTAQLMRTPHYQKLGEIGIFTVVQKAKSIGLNPLDALNGAMYFVNGKVELAANTMNYMIRAKGHSITKDKKSSRDICILNGKRADNGDEWTASFSIEEAKKAGIYKSTWEKYPEDMLFARALTRLARQLFPDVIKGCYVEGEIQDAIYADKNVRNEVEEQPKIQAVKGPETISDEQAEELYNSLKECSEEFQNKINDFCRKGNVSEDLKGLPALFYERLKMQIEKDKQACKAALQEQAVGE